MSQPGTTHIESPMPWATRVLMRFQHWDELLWVWPALAMAALLGLLMLMGYLDGRAEEKLARQLETRHAAILESYAKGRSAGHAEMLATAETGWRLAHEQAAQCSDKAGQALLAQAPREIQTLLQRGPR